MIAYEMALQLQQQGEKTELLALIDSYAGTSSAPGDDEVSLLGEFALNLGLEWQATGLAPADIERSCRQMAPEERMSQLLALARKQGLVPPDLDIKRIFHLFEVFKSIARAVQTYKPGIYDGSLVLFRSAEKSAGTGKAAYDEHGWHALVKGKIDMHEVPGDHYTMLRKANAGSLANGLKRYLS